jgi:hypothetical protein
MKDAPQCLVSMKAKMFFQTTKDTEKKNGKKRKIAGKTNLGAVLSRLLF